MSYSLESQFDSFHISGRLRSFLLFLIVAGLSFAALFPFFKQPVLSTFFSIYFLIFSIMKKDGISISLFLLFSFCVFTFFASDYTFIHPYIFYLVSLAIAVFYFFRFARKGSKNFLATLKLVGVLSFCILYSVSIQEYFDYSEEVLYPYFAACGLLCYYSFYYDFFMTEIKKSSRTVKYILVFQSFMVVFCLLYAITQTVKAVKIEQVALEQKQISSEKENLAAEKDRETKALLATIADLKKQILLKDSLITVSNKKK
jgi:hypothetical protein